MLVERLKVRIPMIHSHGIETSWVEALVFNREVAIHPSLNHPGAGIWTVTLARCGQGLIHLPSPEEAAAFAQELVKQDWHLEEVVDYRKCPSQLVGKLTQFIGSWGARRVRVLPKYLAQLPRPAGVEVEGWRQMASDMEKGKVLGPDGMPVEP